MISSPVIKRDLSNAPVLRNFWKLKVVLTRGSYESWFHVRHLAPISRVAVSHLQKSSTSCKRQDGPVEWVRGSRSREEKFKAEPTHMVLPSVEDSMGRRLAS